jgi:D-alanyl-lipoteichoic acid acyltransferase DltB (MBOAT superfamily)
MLFNSYPFLLVFLPAAIAIYAVADRYPPARMPVLITLSLIFYGYWDVRFVPLMLVSIAGNWYAARLFAATKNRAILTAAIVANLAVLGTFKYTNFLADNLADLIGRPIAHVSLVLPLGISFFTFHHIMYLADLRRGRAPIYPLDRYALYICFFPQAISGPIARWNEVMEQFGRRAFAPGWERRCAVGATFVILGLLQKTVLADPLGTATDPIYARAAAGPVTGGDAWMALAFAFQVFFDFAGYSDIAIGLALIFGIELPRNFDAPFRATSMLEFWQRWHMTLARFLRDYVFTPLSRLRIGGTKHRITRLLAALLLTMALCGLWHGAGWHYVVWGTLQGVGLVVAAVWRTKLPSVPAVIGWAATVGFFIVTIVFFRANSLTDAWHIYQGLATLPDDFHPTGRNVLIEAIVCAILLPPSHEICRRLTEVPNRYVAAGLAVAATAVIILLGKRENFQFVYFQF